MTYEKYFMLNLVYGIRVLNTQRSISDDRDYEDIVSGYEQIFIHIHIHRVQLICLWIKMIILISL